MDTKPWYLSKGVWGGLIAAAAGIMASFGLDLPFEAGVMSESMVAILGGVLAVWGRLKASTKLG